MTTLFLIRHAHAGDRDAWAGPDGQRPLSAKGWRQARGLVQLLAPYEIGRIDSSPSLRCVQTVQPLAEARGLVVQEDQALLEGSDPTDGFDALERQLDGASVAACTHGDLVPAILEQAVRAGASLPPQVRWQKGSTWILDRRDGHWTGVRYLPPADG